MTTRLVIPALLACLVLPHAVADTVSGSYHFTTPQTQQSMTEAATMVKVVGTVSQTSADISTATLTFSGSLEGVAFAEWVLPQIDKATGDGALHEYTLPSGDMARVVFVPNATKPQEMQELLTVARTVADMQKIYIINSNHALVMRGPEWEVLFSQWIIDQLNVPGGRSRTRRHVSSRSGGPDFRAIGHGARVNFLTSRTSPLQMQELLTVLRTVGYIQKIFSYSSGHALVMRASDTDLQRAEWLIQQLDVPAGTRRAPERSRPRRATT